MAVVTTQACQFKQGLFGRCGATATGLCQYCARHFCKSHGTVQEDGQEVCHRPACVAKRDDLVVHLAYKEQAQVRNEQRLCGVEGCRIPVTEYCERCRCYFCGVHVETREEIVREARVRVRRISRLCDHCWQRRPIWLRD